MAPRTRHIRWRHVLPGTPIVQRAGAPKVVASVSRHGLVTEAWFRDGSHQVRLSASSARVPADAPEGSRRESTLRRGTDVSVPRSRSGLKTRTPEVTVVRWPDEADRASRLAEAGGALLYLVGDDDEPPTVTSCLADWVRLPSGARDLDARIAVLDRRARDYRQPPFVDDDGYLHYLGSLVYLPPLEARLAAALTGAFGEVVPDDALVERGVVTASGAARVLRGQMAHLRAQLRPVGLSVHRVRGRGYRVQGH